MRLHKRHSPSQSTGTFPNCSTAGFPSGRYPPDTCDDVSKTDAVLGLSRGNVSSATFSTFNVWRSTRTKGCRRGCKRSPCEEKSAVSPAMRPTKQHGESGTMKVRSNTARLVHLRVRVTMYVYARREKNQRILFTDIVSNDKRCMLELSVSWMIAKIIRWIDAISMHLNRQLTLVLRQLAITVTPSILTYYINAILTDSVNGIPMPRWCKPWHCPLDIEILVLAGITGCELSYFADDRLKETPLCSPRGDEGDLLSWKRQVESLRPFTMILERLSWKKWNGKYFAFKKLN